MLQINELLKHIPVLNIAYEEQQAAVLDVWRHAEEILKTDTAVPERFRVTLGPMPDTMLSFYNNMISTPFLAVLQPLGITPERRKLYGKLNHLFRTWVTSADNLLDNEDKINFPVQMSGKNAFVMRQVVVIMLADRIMQRILAEAQENGVLNQDEARVLSDESLRILLPSAAEEAFEEGGLTEWPEPDYVLNQLHPLKTGILFRIPFLGPEKIETGLDPEKFYRLKAALQDFGIGCQMIDDIRDLSRDFIQRRANYLIAILAHGPHAADMLKLLEQVTSNGDLNQRLDDKFPEEVKYICENAVKRLQHAFTELDVMGLSGFQMIMNHFIAILMARMDLEHLIKQFVVV